MKVFSLVIGAKETKEPWDLVYRTDGAYFCNPDTMKYEKIIGSEPNRPLLTFKDKISLSKGDLINLKEDVDTTVGRVFVNTIAITIPLGDKIDFQNSEFDISKVELEIAKRLVTDPEYRKEDEIVPENPILVREYLKFTDTILSLEGYSQLCVPSASPKTLTSHPDIPKIRKALLEEYKDQLDDPVIVAKIEKVLTDLDREWIKGDVSEGFFIKGKHFDEIRKKMHVIYGTQSAFDTDPELIPTSLNEGWDIEKLPGMINSLREGSYARGKGTGLGGYATKVVDIMLQNIAITEDDCGSKLGWTTVPTEDTLGDFIGFYRILSNGKPELMTEDNIKPLIGKEIVTRSPQFCKTPKLKFCKTCLGEPNALNPKALTSNVAGVTTTLMLLEMKKFHVSNLEITNYDINEVF